MPMRSATSQQSSRTQDRTMRSAGHDREERALRYQGLLEQLSAEERSALQDLTFDPPRRPIPRDHALRLLSLGLAELNCGRLMLTRAGRNAVVALRRS